MPGHVFLNQLLLLVNHDGHRARPDGVQGDAGNEPDRIDARAADAVVEVRGIGDAFRDAEPGPRRQAPKESAAPGLLRRPAIMPQQGDGLAHLLAKTDAEREAEKTEDKAVLRIERRPVRRADELEQIQQQHQDAVAAQPEAVRPESQPLHEQKEQDADRRREQPDAEQVQRLRGLAGRQQKKEGHE